MSAPLLMAFVGFTIVAVIVVVVILIGNFRRRVLLPLQHIEKALHRRRTGMRDARVTIESDDELGDVAAAVNSAFDALDAQYAQIRRLAVIAAETDTSAVIAAPDGTIEWVNRGFTRITGYSQDEVRGHRLAEYQHPDTTNVRDVRRFWNRLRAGGRAVLEMQARTKDGRRITAAMHGFPLLDASGRVTSCICLAEDITESRIVRQEIFAMLNRFQQELAFDLHDHVGGDLGGLAFRAKTLAEQLEASGRPEARLAAELTAALGDVADRTRALSRLLAPTSREQGGLASAMNRLCQSARGYSSSAISLRMSESLPELDAWQASHVYLIAQECLRNAIRHGTPSRIHVNLVHRPDVLVLCITSSQRPWEPEAQETGLGMRIIQYRAETLNATHSIRVRPGGVTRFRLIVPLRWGDDAGALRATPRN